MTSRWEGVMEAPDLTKVQWRKSTFSSHNGECVEVAGLPDGRIAVRNSNQPDAGVVLFTRAEMAAFIKSVKASEFDDLT